jgi:putative flippase GtrA
MAKTARLRSEAGRFLGVGMLSYSLGLGLSALFREGLGLPAEYSVALTLAILFLINFWLSRRYVFRAGGDARKQFALFVITASAMRGGEYAAFYLLFQFAHLHYLAALTSAMVISNGLKFFLYRALVFGRRISTASAAK